MASAGTSQTDRLRDVVDRVVRGAGHDLDELTVTPAGRRRVVRVVIDSDDGVSLDDAAEVSRRISDELDREGSDDVVGAQAYTLEVTSRGVGRPLTLPRHYRRALGRLLKVRTVDGVEVTGHVVDASDTAVSLLTGPDGRDEALLTYQQIARAAVEVEFGPPPRAVTERLDAESGASEDGRS